MSSQPHHKDPFWLGLDTQVFSLTPCHLHKLASQLHIDLSDRKGLHFEQILGVCFFSQLKGLLLIHDNISTNYAGSWTDKEKDKDERQSRSTTNQLPSSRDWVGDFLVWKPPVGLEKSQSFWAILTIWIALVGAALFLQK
ncbi:hypothetical protein MTR67_022305 [Solanum verrucosum]|uniref:Uncharacterized protein n=1 Tax=Solanum verrucosum TaxID=315347 RepID=A0AAF0QXL8_SOLVR|nr:hypothetical protein MTR67_022305 [Solanum verrucosum]